MRSWKDWLSLPKTTIILFALAILLLLGSSFAGARAALTYYSDTYASKFQMHDIGVTLVENDKNIAYRDYFYNKADGTWDQNVRESTDPVLLDELLFETNDCLRIGRAYQERLSVMNSGTIDAYVRVNVYRYWVHLEEEWLTPELIAMVKKEMKDDVDGNKYIPNETKAIMKQEIEKQEITVSNINVHRFLRAYNILNHTNKTMDDFKIRTVSPSAIDLHFVNLKGMEDGEQCWIEDLQARTMERNVFYYHKPLASNADGSGEITPLLSDTLTIQSFPVSKTTLKDKEDGTYILYGADGNFFVLDVRVDAVQDHNARDAILSAWGVKVNIDNNKVLSLADEPVRKEEVQDEENQ